MYLMDILSRILILNNITYLATKPENKISPVTKIHFKNENKISSPLHLQDRPNLISVLR